MIVIEKNEGIKIPHSLRVNKLTLGEEITLDISKYERDFDVHLDVCQNAYGMLTMGVSTRYVAQIDIPARRYTLEDDGEDDQGMPRQKKTAEPFSMDTVTLTLWALGV